MSTRFVRTVCCDVPVVLSDPNTQALTARAICGRCRSEVGTPGVEDGPGVDRFVAYAAALQAQLAYESRLRPVVPFVSVTTT